MTFQAEVGLPLHQVQRDYVLATLIHAATAPGPLLCSASASAGFATSVPGRRRDRAGSAHGITAITQRMEEDTHAGD